MEKLGISVSLMSDFHPQANGQIERANQEIGCFLRAFCAGNQEDWVQFLPWADYAQNTIKVWFQRSEQVLEQAQHLQHAAQVTKKFANRWRGETPDYGSPPDSYGSQREAES